MNIGIKVVVHAGRITGFMRLYSFVYKSLFSVIFIVCFFVSSGQDAKYYCSKGDEFYRNRNYDQAIIQYTMAINVDPNYIYAYQWRASAYTAKNEPDLAIADCNTCISLQPGNKFAWANRGYAYARKSQFDLAIEDYSEAIRLDPQYAWAYANRGFAYGQLNYPEHAIRDLSMSLLYDPNNAITYSNRYHAYFKVNEPDSALMDITKAISLSPATAGEVAGPPRPASSVLAAPRSHRVAASHRIPAVRYRVPATRSSGRVWSGYSDRGRIPCGRQFFSQGWHEGNGHWE